MNIFACISRQLCDRLALRFALDEATTRFFRTIGRRRRISAFCSRVSTTSIVSPLCSVAIRVVALVTLVVFDFFDPYIVIALAVFFRDDIFVNTAPTTRHEIPLITDKLFDDAIVPITPLHRGARAQSHHGQRHRTETEYQFRRFSLKIILVSRHHLESPLRTRQELAQMASLSQAPSWRRYQIERRLAIPYFVTIYCKFVSKMPYNVDIFAWRYHHRWCEL